MLISSVYFIPWTSGTNYNHCFSISWLSALFGCSSLSVAALCSSSYITKQGGDYQTHCLILTAGYKIQYGPTTLLLMLQYWIIAIVSFFMFLFGIDNIQSFSMVSGANLFHGILGIYYYYHALHLMHMVGGILIKLQWSQQFLLYLYGQVGSD